MKKDTNQENNLIDKGKKGVSKIVFGRTLVVIVLLVLQFGTIFAGFAIFERYVSVAYGSMTVISVFMAIYISKTKDNPSIKLSWMALVMLAPIFGSLLYFFIQKDLGHRMMKKSFANILSETEKYFVQDNSVLKDSQFFSKELYNMWVYASSVGRFPLYHGKDTEYFPQGETAFESMLEELKKAEKFIFIEFFIIERGKMWDSVLEILKEKAKHGVEVRVIYDGTCSVSLLPTCYPKKLAQYNIKCKVFSPLLPLLSTHYNNRDHRKIMVIDGKIAFTGGINLADEYINQKVRFGHWKDCAIKITGNAVNSFTLMFLQMWNITSTKENYQKYLFCSQQQNSENNGFILPFADSPLDGENVGETVYMDIINNSKDYLYIMTPYLIIDNELVTCIKNASKRGVDVKIILPHIPDHKLAFNIAKSYYRELTLSGVEIYEYSPGFIHSKVFLSDDMKAVVGTINLDYRSLYLHFECAVYLFGCRVLEDIKADFVNTFSISKKIELSDIKREGFLGSMKRGLLRLFAPLM